MPGPYINYECYMLSKVYSYGYGLNVPHNLRSIEVYGKMPYHSFISKQNNFGLTAVAGGTITGNGEILAEEAPNIIRDNDVVDLTGLSLRRCLLSCPVLNPSSVVVEGTDFIEGEFELQPGASLWLENDRFNYQATHVAEPEIVSGQLLSFVSGNPASKIEFVIGGFDLTP